MTKRASRGLKIALIVFAAIVIAVGIALAAFFGYIANFNARPNAHFDIAAAQTDGDEITVMNFNVRCITADDTGQKSWFNRAPRVIKQISEVKPDIICFQEVTHVHEEYLKNALDGYGYTIKYRNGGMLAESTPIFYNLGKFEEVETGGFWLSETPDKKSKGWGAATYRVASYAVLKQKSDGKTFVVFNTHLDHKSELARRNGIRLVLDKIAEFGNLPSMLLGDMNSYLDSDAYAEAIQSFDDSRVIAQNTEAPRNTYHAYGKRADASPIDYCFVLRDKFDVSSYRVVAQTVDGYYASDHYALEIKLSVK